MSQPKRLYLHTSADGVDPKVVRAYDAKFRPSARYLATIPDIMDAAHDAIQGAHIDPTGRRLQFPAPASSSD